MIPKHHGAVLKMNLCIHKNAFLVTIKKFEKKLYEMSWIEGIIYNEIQNQ